MAKESSNFDFISDDFHLSFLFNETQDDEKCLPSSISDASYAEELQLQEAIEASLITSMISQNAEKFKAKETTTNTAVTEQAAGESSGDFCKICAENKASNDMFQIRNCSHDHLFCSDCIGKYVTMRIQESALVVRCPGFDCKGVVELDSCRSIVAREVVEKWDEMLCESMINASERFYCPYRDCSAMLVNDEEEEVIRESECPFCHRLFCAQCYVPWHSGVDCEEFRRLDEDERGRADLMARELAKEKKWKRCPNCRFYVEKTEGCLHITCRCGFEYCYACGATWSSTHGGCQ